MRTILARAHVRHSRSRSRALFSLALTHATRARPVSNISRSQSRARPVSNISRSSREQYLAQLISRSSREQYLAQSTSRN